MQRALAAESRVHLLKPSEFDRDFPEGEAFPEGSVQSHPAEKEREWHFLGAKRWGQQSSQPGSVAQVGCCAPMPSKESRTWPVMMMGSDTVQVSQDKSALR